MGLTFEVRVQIELSRHRQCREPDTRSGQAPPVRIEQRTVDRHIVLREPQCVLRLFDRRVMHSPSVRMMSPRRHPVRRVSLMGGEQKALPPRRQPVEIPERHVRSIK